MASFAHRRGFGKPESIAVLATLTAQWTPDQIQGACHACGHVWRDGFWSPLQTLWTFLWQVLHAGSACREAVASALAQRGGAGHARRPSPDPSAYCQARQRLPWAVLEAGVRTVRARLEGAVATVRTWCGRRVRVVDGSRVSMPDTPALQAAFGQPTGQKRGCGFPVATIVALFDWASGAVLGAATGAYRTSELALWRGLWPGLRPGDVVLGDRFYCTFADLAGVIRRGCDGVFRLHQRRPCDFRRGVRLGPLDRVVTWEKPRWSARARGMTRDEWGALPDRLRVRLIRTHVEVHGFRTRQIDVATTLLDPAAYPRERIVALYRDRWMVELRLRDLKTTLGMDVLRGKSADIVRKEIVMHLLAYNLIRTLMWQAAEAHGVDLGRLSFAGTVARLNAVAPYLFLFDGDGRARTLYALLLEWIAHDLLPDRPNRVEPRVLKRRPNNTAE